MEEQLPVNNTRSVNEYWRIAKARRWWILGPFFLCWLVVWGLSWMIPTAYRSETLIIVERQRIPEKYVVPNVATDLQARLQSMTQQILSRTRLLKIVNEFDLYPKLRQRDPDALVTRMRDDIDIELVESKDKRELSAFKIYYNAPTPQVAQAVAGQLTSLFIEENLQAQQQQSESTTQFLSAQVEEYRKELAGQEAKIKDFKMKYLGELPTQLQSNVQILGGLQTRQQLVSEALARAQQEKLYLESLVSQYQSAQKENSGETGIASDAATKQEIARVTSELADAEARYKEDHPDVVRLRTRLADLKKTTAEPNASAGEADRDAELKLPNTRRDPSADTPLMQLQSQLKSNALEIRNRSAELKEVQDQIGEYQARLHRAPMREQQLTDLTRNYEQQQASYDSLVKKQLESQLATNLERQQQGQQFRIVDAPSLPEKPYSPDRRKLSIVAVVAGLVLGLLGGILAESLDGRVRCEDDLNALVDARVIATIPRFANLDAERHAWRQWLLEGALVATIILLVTTGNVLSFIKG